MRIVCIIFEIPHLNYYLWLYSLASECLPRPPLNHPLFCIRDRKVLDLSTMPYK